ncbi:MAG: peptide deformylase [Candidatus Micrarchaeia archaeon]|jgi:peptide deformylase
MTVKPILLAGNPVLRQRAKPIDPLTAVQLVSDLRDTLMDFRSKQGLGRGIAAPQIGISQRAIYVSMEGFEGELLNPRITWRSEEKLVTWDGCFSFKAAFFAKVERPKEIEVEYFDVNGQRHTLKADLDLSELLQHEIEHLDGILFIDKIVRQGDYLIMREEWERMGRPSKA